MLSTLKQINLRKVWAHEAYDFTNWLVKEENIKLLEDEVGISLEDILTEQSVGKYKVDILATDSDTQQKVVIENQLEQTDHRHLGQIITYASGYEASVIIWIVKDAREEHKKAIEWLNNNTNSKISFILIRMELWQIGDSPFAPKFHILVEPNDWAKQLKENNNQNSSLTDTKQLQLEFWKGFKEFYNENDNNLKINRKPRAQHWYDINYGTSNSHISLTINSRENKLGCDLYIPKSQELFVKLYENKKEIEQEIGAELLWLELEDKMASRVKIEKQGDFTIQESWDDYFLWLKTFSEKFAKVFAKYN